MLGGFDNALLETVAYSMVLLTPQDKPSYFLEGNQSGFNYWGTYLFDNVRATNPCHGRISVCSAVLFYSRWSRFIMNCVNRIIQHRLYTN